MKNELAVVGEENHKPDSSINLSNECLQNGDIANSVLKIPFITVNNSTKVKSTEDDLY